MACYTEAQECGYRQICSASWPDKPNEELAHLCSFGTVEMTHTGQTLNFSVNIFSQGTYKPEGLLEILLGVDPMMLTGT